MGNRVELGQPGMWEAFSESRGQLVTSRDFSNLLLGTGYDNLSGIPVVGDIVNPSPNMDNRFLVSRMVARTNPVEKARDVEGRPYLFFAVVEVAGRNDPRGNPLPLRDRMGVLTVFGRQTQNRTREVVARVDGALQLTDNRLSRQTVGVNEVSIRELLQGRHRDLRLATPEDLDLAAQEDLARVQQ